MGNAEYMGLISRVSSRTYRQPSESGSSKSEFNLIEKRYQKMSRSYSRSPRRDRSRSRSRDRRRRSRSGSRDRKFRDPRRNEDGTYKTNLANPSSVIGVFGVSYSTDERTLERKFEKFGRIEKCTLVWSHMYNRSRGYGFITYRDARDAKEAVEEMNGRTLDGREIRVDYSFSKDGRDRIRES